MSEIPAAELLVDFQELPLQKAADVLRGIGEQLFRGLMAKPPQLAWPVAWEGEVPAFWRSRKIWRASKRRKLVEGLPFGKKIDHFLQRRYFRRLMRGKVTWDHYRNHFAKGVQTQMQAGTMLGLTPEMWCLAGQAAWLGPDFQHPINRILDQRLRSEVLLKGGRPPRVFISPRTIWALLALASLQPVAGRINRKMDSQLRKLRLPLGELAQQIAMGTDWAGFWDQWLLIRALPLVRVRFPDHEVPLLHALKDLPLRKAAGSKALPPKPLPPRFFLAKWWWYLRFGMASIGRGWRAFIRKPLAPPQPLADPDWRHQAPGWLEQMDPIARNL